MRPIKIITDSCCDLPKDYRAKFDLSYILLSLSLKGQEAPAVLDMTAEEEKDFYDGLRHGERVYVLSATEHAIHAKFAKYISLGNDIIFVTCSSTQTATGAKAKKIAQKLMEENPEARIEIYDSRNVSFGEGLLAIKACEHRDAGMDIDGILAALEEDRKHLLQYMVVGDPAYLAQANLITASSGRYAHLFDIHPILVSDVNGHQTTLCRIRGYKKAIDYIIDLFCKNVVDPAPQHLFIGHGDEAEVAEYVKNALIEKGVVAHRIHVECLGTEIGARVGPGSIVIFGFGREIAFERKNRA